MMNISQSNLSPAPPPPPRRSRFPLIFGLFLFILCLALIGSTWWLLRDIQQVKPAEVQITAQPLNPTATPTQLEPPPTPRPTSTVTPQTRATLEIHAGRLPVPTPPEIEAVEDWYVYVSASADTGGNGSLTRPYQDIQSAIDGSLPRSTLLIAIGTYPGPIEIRDTTLTLIGGYDPASWERCCIPMDTIIDGMDRDRAVTIIDSEVYLQGLTITGGHNFCPEEDQRSGGGLGVFGSFSQVILDRMIIVDNVVDPPCGGGGIETSENASIYIYNSLIIQNQAGDGGGVLFSFESNGLIANSTIADNTFQGLRVMPESGSYAILVNTILWNNGGSADDELVGDDLEAHYCLVGVDPQLAGYRYMPTSNSPVIDAGHWVQSIPEWDIWGAPRISGMGIDIGAFEYPDL